MQTTMISTTAALAAPGVVMGAMLMISAPEAGVLTHELEEVDLRVVYEQAVDANVKTRRDYGATWHDLYPAPDDLRGET